MQYLKTGAKMSSLKYSSTEYPPQKISKNSQENIGKIWKTFQYNFVKEHMPNI